MCKLLCMNPEGNLSDCPGADVRFLLNGIELFSYSVVFTFLAQNFRFAHKHFPPQTSLSIILTFNLCQLFRTYMNETRSLATIRWMASNPRIKPISTLKPHVLRFRYLQFCQHPSRHAQKWPTKLISHHFPAQNIKLFNSLPRKPSQKLKIYMVSSSTETAPLLGTIFICQGSLEKYNSQNVYILNSKK